MKELNIRKVKVAFIVILLLLCSLFSNNSFAIELEANLSQEFIEWSELEEQEKKNSMMPQTIYGEAPSEILEMYEYPDKVPSILAAILMEKYDKLENVSATTNSASFDLNEKLKLRVEDQGKTTECWAFSSIKALETNIALSRKTNELMNFSERHMDYATTKTFKDGSNPIGYGRELGGGGLPIVAYSYLTNGTGAVLESDMPFENNENKINLAQIDKKVDTIVTDYITLPTVHKQYVKDAKGNTISVKYMNNTGKEYTTEELNAVRKIIKDQLVTNGAISSITAANKNKYYNTPDIFKAINYNCNSTTERRDHAITIIGWDDNYSKNNFKDGTRPSTNGAYIVLNSYGPNNFNNGYLYISYEDYFIESEIYGVQSAQTVDYDRIYQNDFYGGIFQVGASNVKTGYLASTFVRKTSKPEKLNSVGVTIANYSKVEIYVNTNGANLDKKSLVKVGESKNILSPGYHRINVTPTVLKGNEFAIVVKQTSEGKDFYFSIETRVPGTAYSEVRGSGRSFFSFDCEEWQNVNTVTVSGVDMKEADTCIKGFTTMSNEPVKPETYLELKDYVIENNKIKNIPYGTTIKEFKTHIIRTSGAITFRSETGKVINNENTALITGMKLNVENYMDFELEVNEKDPEPEIEDITSNVYIIDKENKTISKIPEGTTVFEFKKNVETKQEMVFSDAEGKLLGESSIITKGSRLKVGKTLDFSLVIEEKEPETYFEIKDYVVENDKIKNIPYGTTIQEFKTHVIRTSGNLIFKDKDGNELSDENTELTTGMKLNVENYKEFELEVNEKEPDPVVEDITSNVYLIDKTSKTISKIPEGTKVSEFKKNVETKQEMIFSDAEGKILNDDSVITKGSKVKVGETLEFVLIIDEKEPEQPPTGPKVSSEKYKVTDEYILNITHNTKLSELQKNISTVLEKSILTEDNQVVSSEDAVIKTGMRLVLSDGSIYYLVVRGDINKDGKLTLTDVSKLVLHYNENKGFIITDKYALKACDMNFDDKISLTDVSQIVLLYNSID